MPHPIGFTGPDDHYEPPVGMNFEYPGVNSAHYNIVGGYADTNYLNDALTNLHNHSQAAINDMEAALEKIALNVTSDPNDTKLAQAHEILWPKHLGPTPNYVTYRYYKSLENVDSAAAHHVRAAYEKACRGVTGNNAIDLLPMAQMCSNEADLIQEFTSKNATQLSDSSQRRTVELLQDWVETATQHVLNVQTIFAQGGTLQQLPDAEVNSLSPQDARNSQAVFQVNVNQLNNNISNALGTLHKNFSSYASTFYNNFLGPAVNFRNTITTNLAPEVMPTQIGSHLTTATSSLNLNLQNVLADQLRRNQIFDSQTQNTLVNVQLRDTYRSYIQQLSTTGTPAPSGSGTTVTQTDTPEAASYFNALTTATATPSNPFLSQHSELTGRDDIASHPQYLLKAGDEISGAITMTPDATIDGIHPSTHAHTGHDGSAQIDGRNILPGTISIDSLNSAIQPDSPTNLHLISQVLSGSPGNTQVDVVIGWTGDPGLTYEVQLVKADS